MASSSITEGFDATQYIAICLSVGQDTTCKHCKLFKFTEIL